MLKPICPGCGYLYLHDNNAQLCDACLAAAGIVAETCSFCARGFSRDATGLLHVTKGGGHLGPCSSDKPTQVALL